LGIPHDALIPVSGAGHTTFFDMFGNDIFNFLLT
jgi:hypothetical protein